VAQSAAADAAGTGLSAVEASIAFVPGEALVPTADGAAIGVDVPANLFVLFEEAAPAHSALVVAGAIGKDAFWQAARGVWDTFAVAAFFAE
jgi:hypothetical protein